MDERIEKILQDHPDMLKVFIEKHQDILIDLRARFQAMIAEGDMVSRYLLCKALFETIEIQGQVAKQHITKQAQDMEYNIVVDDSKTKH